MKQNPLLRGGGRLGRTILSPKQNKRRCVLGCCYPRQLTFEEYKAINLAHIIPAKKCRVFFERFLYWSVWGLRSRPSHPSDIKKLDAFICAMVRYRADVRPNEIEDYLISEHKWEPTDAAWVRDRMETGLDVLKVYRKFWKHYLPFDLLPTNAIHERAKIKSQYCKKNSWHGFLLVFVPIFLQRHCNAVATALQYQPRIRLFRKCL